MKTVKFPIALILASLFALTFGCSPDTPENEVTTADFTSTVTATNNSFGGVAPNGAYYTNTILVEYVMGTTEPEKQAIRDLYYDTDYLVDHEFCATDPFDPWNRLKEIWYVNHDCVECRPTDTCRPTCDPDNNGDVDRAVFDGDCNS